MGPAKNCCHLSLALFVGVEFTRNWKKGQLTPRTRPMGVVIYHPTDGTQCVLADY